MKVLVAVAMVLTFSISASSECVTVTGPPETTMPSFRNAQITVLRDAKPQAGVRLMVSLANGHRDSFVTDSHGMAILDYLPAGTNCVTAISEDYFQAHLCLGVSKESERKLSAFELTLADTLLPRLPMISGSASPEVLRHLEMVVQDASGGIVAHAEVRVYVRDSYPNNPLVKAWTDQDGRLTVPLDPGTYAVSVRSPGFAAAVRVIEISNDGRTGPVREVLQPGGC